MHTHVIILSFLAAALSLQAETPKDKLAEIGFLPTQKRGIRVDPEERNPYAERAVKKIATQNTETEADQIRKVLEGMRVQGASSGPGGRSVLFGDLILREGQELPPLLVKQKDRLKVTSVTETEVEISWITESGTQIEDGRKISIMVDLEPRVIAVLPGQMKRGKDAKPRMDWVRRPGEPAPPEEVASNDKIAAKEDANVTVLGAQP